MELEGRRRISLVRPASLASKCCCSREAVGEEESVVLFGLAGGGAA